MLPDLRIVIAAVVSTFVLTVGVGFYASSRLIDDPKISTDSIAALDATPVNRIALSWPAPARHPEPLALDFAVTAKALRNPVRDVTGEPSVAVPTPEPQTPPVRTTAIELAIPPADSAKPPAAAVPPELTKTEVAPVEVTPPQESSAEATPTEVEPTPVVVSKPPKPAPEPDIRVAVQYPPILEFPPELQAPIVPTPSVAAVETPAEPPASTGSITQPPGSVEAVDDPAPSPGKEKETGPHVASRPEPADASTSDDPRIEEAPMPKPAPKLIPAKPAKKKAVAKKAPKKVVRRPVRRAAPAAPATVPNFFNFFTLQQPR